MTTPDERDPYAPPPEDGSAPTRPPTWGPPAQPGPGVDVPGRPSLPPRVPAVDRAGRTAALLGLAGVMLSVLFFPVGLLLDVAAVAVGVGALRRARQTGAAAPGAISGVVTGLLGGLLALGALVFVVTFWAEISAYRSCVSGANTEIARGLCEETLRESLGRRLPG